MHILPTGTWSSNGVQGLGAGSITALQPGGRDALWFFVPLFNPLIWDIQSMWETSLSLLSGQGIQKGTWSLFYRKLSWDVETLMSRLELHKWWSLDPAHKYVLLRPHQNGSAFKVLTSVGVSKLLEMIKLRAFSLVRPNSIRLSMQPGLRTGGWHLSTDCFSSSGVLDTRKETHLPLESTAQSLSAGHIIAVWSTKCPLLTRCFWTEGWITSIAKRGSQGRMRLRLSGKQLELWMWKGWSCYRAVWAEWDKERTGGSAVHSSKSRWRKGK